MRFIRPILFLCALIFSRQLSAQEKADFDDWEVKILELPGGSQGNSVQKIFNDQQGYLWFASQKGLHRYDGKIFKTFNPEPGNPESISSSYVEHIVQDDNGYLWFATFGKGLNRYDPQTERFKQYRRDISDPLSLSSDSISSMALAPDGTLWLGSLNGLDHFDPQSGQIQHLEHDPQDPHSLTFDAVQDILFDSQGVMWVACGWIWSEETAGKGGLHRYVPEENHFIRYQHDPEDPNSLTDSDVWDIFEDSKGNFWLATNTTGLHLMDREKEIFTYFPRIKSFENQISDTPLGPSLLDRKEVFFPGLRRISEDQTGKLWFASLFEGITVWDPETQQLSVINSFNPNYSNLPHNSFWDIYQARDGSIWLCGGGEGKAILQLRLKQKKLPSFEIPQIAPNIYIQVIKVETPQTLWIGTNQEGAYRYNTRSAKFDHYPEYKSGRGYLNDGDVHDISFDPAGNVWFSGWHGRGGLTRLNPRNNQTKRFRANPAQANSLSSDAIPDLYNSKAGDLWVGSLYNGIDKYNPANENFQQYYLSDSVEKNRPVAFFDALESKEDLLWFSGVFSQDSISQKAFLATFDPLGDSLKTIWVEDSLFDYQNNEPPKNLLEDEAGNLWFLMRSFIMRYDPNLGSMQYFQLPFMDSFNWMIYSKDGALFAGTKEAVFKVWPEEEKIISLPILKGVSDQFISIATQMDEHLWWLGYGNQAYLFDTRDWDAYEGEIPTDVQFGIFTTKDRPLAIGSDLLPSSVNKLSQITVDKSLFPIRIQALATQFNFPVENIIRYRLDPFDDDWRPLKSGNYIYIPEILDATYTLRVQARGPFSDWGPEKILTIIVPKAWWQQWWAFLLYALAIGTFVYLIVRWRTRQQKQKLAQQEEALQREREINERLQHIDRLKDQFLANTSHELRTPLNGIIGLSEALIEDEADTEKRENLSMIISSGKRLSSLVNDILDFSKLRNHEISLRLKAVDLASLVKLVLRIHQPLVSHKEVALINDIPADLPLVWADEDRLQQILFNLVGNAAKFTQSGEIRIRAAAQNEQVQISVHDTGVGIPKDKQASIFQAFEQGDGSTQRTFAGTGLGLTISQRLVELHQGKMWLKSEAGQGATFYFTLPTASAEASAEVSEFAPISAPLVPLTGPAVAATTAVSISAILNANQLRILVVDDEPINQQVLKNHLSSQQYQLSQAMNGEEALRLLDEGPAFDLVLLDVMMPRMSGYEVCQKIREKFLPSELPVIMVTAKNQIADLVEGLDTGANDYLAKPFSKDELLARLKTHLNLHRINKVTNRFVPTAFIRSLGKADLTELQLGDLTKQEVTVFFSDIRDYTGLAERMSPEDTFRFVNAYAGRMGPIIHSHNGFVNQYLGDGIMAIFQQSPEDALRAAIAMQQKLVAYNEERQSQNRRAIAVGMGMHTGPLVMGIIGDETRTDAATIADTVNMAARMEGLTKNFGTHLLLSVESVKGLQNPDQYQLRFLGKVNVKGKQEPQGVYECFDIDSPAQQALKQAQAKPFAEALELYSKALFSQSIVVWEQVLQANPEDRVADYFYQRAKHYLLHGVPDDWQGTA